MQPAASDSVPLETDVTSTVGQGAVDYYRVQVPDDGITLRFDVADGRVLICGSRANRNPNCRDASTYEWRCEANSYCDIYVVSESRKRQVGTNFIFVSIEGINRNNEVVIETTMGDETVSEGKGPIYAYCTSVNLKIVYIIYTGFVFLLNT